jgi:hypothetical protein
MSSPELRWSYNRPLMLSTVRAMPGGIRLFLLYALLILTAIGISLPTVVGLAIGAPLTFEGLVVMALLAYTIFTVTLVLQRKEAGRSLSLGLASLLVPAVLLFLVSGLAIEALFLAAFAALLFRGLLRPDVRGWLNEP